MFTFCYYICLFPRSDTALAFKPNSLKHLANTISEALEYNFSSVELASIISGIVPISLTISINSFFAKDFIYTSNFLPASLKLLCSKVNENKKFKSFI